MALARIWSAVLTHMNSLAPAFQLRMNASIIAMSALTEGNEPRRIA